MRCCLLTTLCNARVAQVEELLAPRPCRHAFVSADDAVCLHTSGRASHLGPCRRLSSQIAKDANACSTSPHFLLSQVQRGGRPRNRVRRAPSRPSGDPRRPRQHRRQGGIHEGRPASVRFTVARPPSLRLRPRPDAQGALTSPRCAQVAPRWGAREASAAAGRGGGARQWRRGAVPPGGRGEEGPGRAGAGLRGVRCGGRSGEGERPPRLRARRSTAAPDLSG